MVMFYSNWYGISRETGRDRDTAREDNSVDFKLKGERRKLQNFVCGNER